MSSSHPPSVPPSARAFTFNPLSNTDFSRIQLELRHSVQSCQNRGLFQSARWAAELLTQLDPSISSSSVSADLLSDLYSLARCYFDLREFDRCAHTLRDLSASSPAALFLRNYSRYLAGERRREEEMQAYQQSINDYSMGNGTANTTNGKGGLPDKPVNKELNTLLNEYSALLQSNPPSPLFDSWNYYLYSILLKDSRQIQMAIEYLLKSLEMYPVHWGAWHLLTSLLQDRQQLNSLAAAASASSGDSAPLASHWIFAFFYADSLLEFHAHENNEVCDLLSSLSELFPNSTHLLAQSASAHYSKREFDAAQELFESLRQLDPFRLDGLDTYSNILYVKEDRAALSFLAHSAFQIDKFSVSTCVIAGNYYSLRGDHEKSIQFFRRALAIDPNYLSAWTLMGHEYIELRNGAAAIECYRRAVEINPKDYRAWYGLGQVYEILQMYTFSLFYHKKAAHLRPFDSRMLCAMAECYEKLNKPEDAIRCYLRAESYEDPDSFPFASSKLGKLYAQRGQQALAAACYRKVLKSSRQEEKQDGDEAPPAPTEETIEALLFLADFAKKQRNYDEAEQYCAQLIDLGASGKENAKTILMEIRALKAKTGKSNLTQVHMET